MSIEQLLDDYGIRYTTEGKNSTEGWININCPFCSDTNYHLGIPENGRVAHCWKCGNHPLKDVLSTILGISDSESLKLIQKYQDKSSRRRKAAEPQVVIKPIKFPQPNGKLTGQYKDYLVKRGFDPDKIEKEWGVIQTGPASFLDGINYSYRILIPIFWNKEMVSFQTRDITGKSDRKYLACPKPREKIHHKNILYGKQECWKNGVIVVEGVMDAWKIGEKAAATFGIEFTMEQVLQLAKINGRIFIVYDNETQAQRQADKLAVKLKALGKEVYVQTVPGKDPGEMKEEDVQYFVKQLLNIGGEKQYYGINK